MLTHTGIFLCAAGEKGSPEHRQPVHGRHLDDKGKQVINNGVEELVGHLAPGQGSHALELVVQVQL